MLRWTTTLWRDTLKTRVPTSPLRKSRRLSERARSKTSSFPLSAVLLTGTRAFRSCWTRSLTICRHLWISRPSRVQTPKRARRRSVTQVMTSLSPLLRSRSRQTRLSESSASSEFTPAMLMRVRRFLTPQRTRTSVWGVSYRCTPTTDRI